MTMITVEEAHTNLAGLIAGLKPGEEVVITRQDRPVARLTMEPNDTRAPRRSGSAVGKLTVVEGDDVHLDDFEQYVP